MSEDIVDRLRIDPVGNPTSCEACIEAADEIERLRAALGSLWDNAETIHHEGERGCFVLESDWRRAMQPIHAKS